ncbi:MAG: hypothetical protein ABFC24_06765 [Methanoregulaceae archaeon]
MDRRFLAILALLLVTLSMGLYTIHYALFGDAHHILIFLIGDIAFVPLEVLLVTLVLHQMLESRERSQRLEKLNMVIGIFFSRVGTDLLGKCARADPDLDRIRSILQVRENCTPGNFAKIRIAMEGHVFSVDPEHVDFPAVRTFFREREDFLLRLLENPVTLEHESFTTLLRAIFHAAEEFDHRTGFSGLPVSDIHHLRGDLNRIYPLLVGEWLDYMEYLSVHYPYLFSLALRTSPFDPDASPVVRNGA